MSRQCCTQCYFQIQLGKQLIKKEYTDVAENFSLHFSLTKYEFDQLKGKKQTNDEKSVTKFAKCEFCDKLFGPVQGRFYEKARNNFENLELFPTVLY